MEFTKSQQAAIDHNNGDLIISAAAGSGKTATLVERILGKIKNGGDISKMLIVTFTTVAAGELKNKICRLIGNELSKNPTNAHLSSQLIKASYADICTIDSFCLKLVRPNFDKLGLDGSFRIGDTGELTVLEMDTMEELIDELFESESENEDFLLVADCYSSFRSESELAQALLELRAKLLNTANGFNTLLNLDSCDSDFIKTPHARVLCEHIFEIVSHFIPIYKDTISELLDSKKANEFYIPDIRNELDYLERIERSLSRGDSYDKLRSIILDYKFERLSQKGLEDGFSVSYFKSERSSVKKAIEDIQKKYFASDESAVISSLKQNAVICRAIFNILSLYEERLQRKKRLFSVYSFNDISTFALKLLYDESGNISELAREVADKYDEIYIDEYQDTNSVQDKIFKAISKNNRFMVGDIKQSIYRFRSAEPEIFSYYRTNFSELKDYNKSSLGTSIFMSNNFRCDKSVIDFSNLVSDYMFKNSRGIPYSDEDKLIFSKEVPSNYSDRKTEIHLLDSKQIPRGDSTKAQAEYVAKRIKKMLDNEYLPDGKKIEQGDIAILLRNTEKQLPYYVEALHKYGINTLYKSSEPFFEKNHILLVLCILNAIDNPSKDIFLAGAMRSDVFGFSLSDLVKIKKRVKSSGSLYSVLRNYSASDDLKKSIDVFLARLNELKEATRGLSAYDAISYVYGSCGLLSMCSRAERHDLMKLYNIAREFEGSSYKGLFSFLKHIDKLSQEYDSKEFKGDATKNSVQLMSIHASKGLEYGVCFVCGIENTYIYLDLADSLLFQRELGVAGYVGRNGGLAKFEPLVRKCIALKKSREMHEEEMRILYVAMTRAKHQLVLTGCVSSPQKLLDEYVSCKKYTSEYDMYSSSSYLRLVAGAIATPDPCFEVNIASSFEENVDCTECTPDEILLSEVEDYKEILSKRINFKYGYEKYESLPSKMSISKLHPAVLDEQNDEIEIPELDSVPKFMADSKDIVNAKQIGIATHVFMQFCDFELLVKNGVESELKRLLDLNYISEQDASLVNKSYIEIFAASELLGQILSAKRVLREFRFNVMLSTNELTKFDELKDEQVLVQGVTDCIFENEDGEIFLVDYKTDFVTEKNYEDVLTDRYTDQLLYYRKACEMMFEKPVSKALIYSVCLGKTVEIK